MKIKDYLEKTKASLQEVADAVGVTKATIWMISGGKLNPSASLAQKISEWSRGEIAINEIRKCTKTCSKGCPCSKGKPR